MRTHILLTVVAGTLMLAHAASAQPYTLVALDVQCPASAEAAACPAGLSPGQVASQTGARGVNSHGDIVGFYVAGGRQRGFVFTGSGFTTIDFPIPGVRGTLANGINDRGEIVGQYTLPVHDLANPPSEESPLYCPAAADPACVKAFHFWRGKFTTLTFPASVDEQGHRHAHPGTIAKGISPDGDIYGCLHDHDTGMSMFGVVWTRFGTSSLQENGGQLSDQMAIPMSMNNAATPGGNTVVGLYTDMFNRTRGYVVRDRMFEPYDATPTATATAIWDISINQHFVGNYRELGDVATKRHAFVQHADGSAAVTFDFVCQNAGGCAGAPFGTVAFATQAFGVNTNGIVVGQYSLINGGPQHAFVAIPPDVDGATISD